MQAIELLTELFYNAKLTVFPRPIVTAGTAGMLRRGQLGKIEGIVIGPIPGTSRMAAQFDTQAGMLQMELDGESAKKALEVLAALPCNFPSQFRRKDVQGGPIDPNDDRATLDLSALGKFGGGPRG